MDWSYAGICLLQVDLKKLLVWVVSSGSDVLLMWVFVNINQYELYRYEN